VVDELNLDVDAPDKVAGVLSAADNAYHASAVELTAAWQDRHIPMIWAAIAGELDRRLEDRKDRQAAARPAAIPTPEEIAFSPSSAAAGEASEHSAPMEACRCTIS
jgi:hypothetical protein